MIPESSLLTAQLFTWNLQRGSSDNGRGKGEEENQDMPFSISPEQEQCKGNVVFHFIMQ